MRHQGLGGSPAVDTVLLAQQRPQEGRALHRAGHTVDILSLMAVMHFKLAAWPLHCLYRMIGL